MQKLRKFISALMAGMTLFSMAPVNAETYSGDTVDDEAAQTESPENSENQRDGVDNLLSWIGNLFLPRVFAAEDDIASGTSGGVTWVIDAEGTLTLSPTDGVSGMMLSFSGKHNGAPWYRYKTQIKKAVAEPGVALGSNARYLFNECSNLVEVDLSDLVVSNVTDMYGMFYDCDNLSSLKSLEGWNVNSVTNMVSMFNHCSSLTSLEPLAEWKTERVTDMSYMFDYCSCLTSLKGLEGWNTSNVTDMSWMFNGCSNLASLEPLAEWDTGNVTGMSSMFEDCSCLTSLEGLKGWETNKVTGMGFMFSDCTNLTSLEPLAKWKTGNVVNMDYMFYRCSNLLSLEPLARWDTSKVISMKCMFYICSKARVADFSNWKFPPEGVDYKNMLGDCDSLSKITISSNFDSYYNRLPGPKKTDEYTGRWAYGDPYNHEIEKAFSKAGTWYWERKGERPLQYYISNSNNIFISEYLESSDGTTSLKQTPEELFPEDGYWQQSDDNTWTYTFYVYDASVQWYVWEEPVLDGYTSTATKENPIIIENGSIVPTITNTLDTMPKDYGKISIQKQLINTSETTQLTDVTFPFRVTISDENNQQLTGTKVFGSITFQNGVAYLSVKPDETVTISNIPAGYHYTVEELPDDKYVQEITNSSGIVQAESQENIMLNNAPAGLVVATNTRIQEEERPYENLVIRKEVTGNVETEEAFEFVAALNNLESDTKYTYGNQTFASDKEGNANVSVSLKNSEEVVFENLPTGTRYRILEEAGNYISSYEISDKNNMGMINQTTDENEATNEELTTAMETVDAGEEVTVTFTNNIMKTQNISISKVVKDAEGQVLTDGSRYEFTVEFSNTEPGTEIQSDLGILRTDDNGQVAASFYLANGETVKFNDIPVGTQYRFTESENSATASYKITDTLENQNTVTVEDANDKPKQELSTSMETVDNGEDAQITFTNTISNGSLTITKKDTNGEPLMGTEFKLVDIDGNVYMPITASTNSEGIITWTELPFGTYTLTETKAPAGASLMKEPMTIEITSETPDVKISITDNSAIYLDAGGTGMVMGITFSSVALALALACILNDYRKKKYSK